MLSLFSSLFIPKMSAEYLLHTQHMALHKQKHKQKNVSVFGFSDVPLRECHTV